MRHTEWSRSDQKIRQWFDPIHRKFGQWSICRPDPKESVHPYNELQHMPPNDIDIVNLMMCFTFHFQGTMRCYILLTCAIVAVTSWEWRFWYVIFMKLLLLDTTTCPCVRHTYLGWCSSKKIWKISHFSISGCDLCVTGLNRAHSTTTIDSV